MSKFIELTRVYKLASSGEVKTQPIVVASDAIMSFRPSNRLGRDNNHRSTLMLVDGSTYDTTSTFSDLFDMIG